MFKLIVPIILIITSGLVGFFEMAPLYKEVKVAKGEEQRINDALQKTKDIGDIAEKLNNKIENISISDFSKLEVILPKNIDEIRFLNMLNSIAQRQNLTLSGLNITSSGNEKTESMATVSENFNIVNIDFSVFAPYETFKFFLNDLEQSLALIDVDSMILSAPQYAADTEVTDSYTYSIKLSTYWIE